MHCPGELGSALKLRLPDSNKVVQALALDVIARLAAGINKPFERFAKSFVGPICGILSDAKVNVRAPAVAALDAIYEQCGLECMLQPVGSSLEVVNPVQRHEVLSWLGRKLSNDESMPDLTVIIGPVISCLEDRSTEVRKSAQAILPNIISSTGYQPLLDKAGNLKPASRSTIIPLLETAKSLCASSGPASSSSSRPSSAAASRATSEKPTSIAQSTMAFRPQAAVSRNLKQTSVTGPRMDSPKSILPGSRLHTAPEAMIASPRSRRVVNATPASILVRDDAVDASREPIHSQLFLTSDASAKSTRASKEIGPLRWAVEGSPRPDQVDYLQQQCLPHVSRGLLGLMFSRDHHSEQDHLAALDMLRSAAEAATYDEANVVASQQEETRRQMIANSDLILKYMSLRLCDNSTSSILSTLALTEAVTQLMLMASYHLTDYEAHCYLPTFVAKVRVSTLLFPAT